MTGEVDGREMVRVLGGTKGCFWVDRHEVTREAYEQFLKAENSFAPGLQGSACQDNVDVAPDAACMAQAATSGDAGKNPVVCVDWCDAAAYCKWAKKRLCEGSFVDANQATKSEWAAACTNNGATAYPHGNTPKAGACNEGCSQLPCPTKPAGSSLDCASGRGVADLTGNVAEWSDECQNSIDLGDSCKVRGGSFKDADATCDTSESRKRGGASSPSPSVGFRCCQDDL